MDEAHLIAAVRYVSLNPVRARLAARTENWVWSSAHLAGADNELATVKPILDRLGQCGVAELWRPDAKDEACFAALRGAESTGRPLGNDDFIKGLERLLRRPIARRAPGRKPTNPVTDQPKLP